MLHQELKAAFLQGDESQASELFNEMLRTSVRLGLFVAMEEEINSLCGAKYAPDPESDYQRAGSEIGSAYINGEKEKIQRPRVRHKEDGEVKLATYQAASSQRNLFAEVVSALSEGVSNRGITRHTKGAVSKSAASRMWVEKSMEQLDLLRTRPVNELDLLCIQIDGVWIGKRCLVLAIGIDGEGNKHALDFEQGSSESKAVVIALIERLRERGIEESDERRLLVIRDGSPAIESAVRSHWPTALQQECLIHQERNAAAGLAFKARKDSLLTVHRLEIPSTLNGTLTNTNIIENTIRNWREATNNVKLWNEKETMIPRWAASGMLWAEAGYRKVRGYRDLPALAAALASSTPASSLRSSACAPNANADQPAP